MLAVELLKQVWDKLFTTCNELDGTVTGSFYYYIAMLLQSCVVNFVKTFLQQVCIRVVETTL